MRSLIALSSGGFLCPDCGETLRADSRKLRFHRIHCKPGIMTGRIEGGGEREELPFDYLSEDEKDDDEEPEHRRR